MHKRCINKVAVAMMTASMLMSTGSMAAIPVMAAGETPAASPKAVTGVSGEQTDPAAKGVISVGGVKDGETVKAYQIVDGVYKDGKLVTYVPMDPTDTGAPIANIATQAALKTYADSSKNQDQHNAFITAAEVTKIADNIQAGTFTADTGTEMAYDATSGTYKASVEPGLYLVLVTPHNSTSEMVYNPAVVAVNITDANGLTTTAGSVNMNNLFEMSADGSTSTYAYIKQSKSQMDKNITSSDKTVKLSKEDAALAQTTGIAVKTDTDNKGGKGDTVAMGDTIHFKIDGMTIPSFSTDYVNPHYYIRDTQDATSFGDIKTVNVTLTTSTGKVNKQTFEISTDKSVKAANVATDATNWPYRITVTHNQILISFNPAWLQNPANFQNAGSAAQPTVSIDYTTALSKTAGINFSENKNHAEIIYSNSPTTSYGAEPSEPDIPNTLVTPPGTPDSPDTPGYHHEAKTTYHYTFGIDADIDAQGSTPDHPTNEETHEFNKVTELSNAGTTDTQEAHFSDGQAKGTNRDNGASEADQTTRVPAHPLAGATFTLYHDPECKSPVKVRTYDEKTGVSSIAANAADLTCISDENGHFSFTGLDEGTYYMNETSAPTGYTLSPMLFRFTIEANLAPATGRLVDYTITTDSVDTSVTSMDSGAQDYANYQNVGTAHYTATYETAAADGSQTVQKIDKTVDPVEVVDTKIANLPSTGGNGTVKFAIVACAFAGAFGAFTVVTRGKKKEKVNR